MRLNVHPTAFVALAAIAGAAWLFARPDETARRADRYLRAQAIATSFTGTVLVSRDDRVSFSRGYGYANAEERLPNGARTRFLIGSITKTFTAAVILQLQEEGKLSVEDSVCVHLEPCPAHWSPIRLRHLLSHSSGLFNYTQDPRYPVLALEPVTHDEILGLFVDEPLAFVPGERYAYSNSGYFLLALVIEAITGRSYGDALSARVLEPLELEDTGYRRTNEPTPGLAAGYRANDDGVLELDPLADPSWGSGDGMLYSTAGDLLAWSRALETGALLGDATRETMWTPLNEVYGYGWRIEAPSPESFERHVRMHGGRTMGFGACLQHFPNDALTVVVLANNVMSDACSIARDLAAIELGESYFEPIARRAVHVDSAILDRYVGRYAIDGTGTIEISRDGSDLVGGAPPSPQRFRLFAESETEFFLKIADIQITFSADGQGNVIGLTLHVRARSLRARRLPD